MIPASYQGEEALESQVGAAESFDEKMAGTELLDKFEPFRKNHLELV